MISLAYGNLRAMNTKLFILWGPQLVETERKFFGV